MNAKNRLDKLLASARGMARRRGQAIRRRQCQNATWEELLRMVEESLLPESMPVIEDIVSQIQEHDRRLPREISNGKLVHDVYGFVYWQMGLQTGSSSLPEKIPHELLLAWRNGHANHPAGATPVPVFRCEACLLVLPNCTVDGIGSCLKPCPACGSSDISYKKLSGNAADGWDPMWVYTPLSESLRNVGHKK
jgi:hypothetical protein